MNSSFSSSKEKFDHCYENIIKYLYEYDDFMESVGTVAGIGSDPEALDIQWWANATTRDKQQLPFNIKCTIINDFNNLNIKHRNIVFQRENVNSITRPKKGFDILWAYDILQYQTNPYETLKNWWHIATTDSMLVLSVPQTTNIEYNKQEFHARMNHKYNFTLPMLIYMLSVNGWDCKSGFFKKQINDPWIHILVYRSSVEPMDPNKTNLYKIAEDTQLLPECVVQSITKFGHLRQRDLVLPWIDKNLTVMENH